MNKQNRKELTAALEQADEALQEIRRIAEEERDKFDNMPEGLQMADAGVAIEEAAEGLEMAADEIESGIEQAREFGN